MDDIERYLDQVCSALGGSKALRLHLREELREHILEAVEKYRADGLEQKPAIQKALQDFGQPQNLRQQLQDVYGRPFVALLIEKAMHWKEKTMKTGWKWSFIAHFALALLITFQIIFIMTGPTLFSPVIQEGYASLQKSAPDYFVSFMKCMRVFYHTWFIWIAPIIVCWALFEWKCHSENKSKIRLAAGTLVSLAMMVLVFISSASIVMPLFDLWRQSRTHEPESQVIQRAQQVNTSFEKLAQAIEKQEWQVAQQSARKLRRTFQSLALMGSAAPILVAMDKREDFDEIRQLFDNIARLSDDISDSIRDMDEPRLAAPHYFYQLEKSYKQLKSKVPDWPSGDQAEQPGRP